MITLGDLVQTTYASRWFGQVVAIEGQIATVQTISRTGTVEASLGFK